MSAGNAQDFGDLLGKGAGKSLFRGCSDSHGGLEVSKMANLRVDKITSTETFETTGSVQFDGNDNYLSGTNFVFGTLDFTIRIICILKLDLLKNQFFAKNFWQLKMVHLIVILSIWILQGNVLCCYLVTSDKLSESTWVHIAMSYSDDSTRCYVDGKEFGRIQKV